jgi:hypothetical protein
MRKKTNHCYTILLTTLHSLVNVTYGLTYDITFNKIGGKETIVIAMPQKVRGLIMMMKEM